MRSMVEGPTRLSASGDPTGKRHPPLYQTSSGPPPRYGKD
jgi:hypothetical protein